MTHKSFSAEERLFAVISDIAKAVAENSGVYPSSRSGKLTLAAVLRMAGLNPSYLEKKNRPHIVAMKERAILELTRIGVLSPRHRVVMSSPTSRKGGNLDRSETIAVMQAYAEAELQYQATLKDLDAARSRIVELEVQVRTLQQQVAHVIPISRSRS